MSPCRPAKPFPTCSLQMKEKALAASDTTLDTASRTALNDEFKSLRDQITKVVTNAVVQRRQHDQGRRGTTTSRPWPTPTAPR